MNRYILLATVPLLAIASTLDAWQHLLAIAGSDAEAGYIFLAPIVCLYLLLSTPEQSEVRSKTIHPVFLTASLSLSAAAHLAHHFESDSLWHLFAIGSLLAAIGAVTSLAWFLARWPAWIALLMASPWPHPIRQAMGLPLQEVTAGTVELLASLAGFEVTRLGQTITFHDTQLTIAEACNGLRLMQALTLLTYGVAFALRLSTRIRIAAILAAPIFAIAANIVRLLMLLWAYSTFPRSTADAIHDGSGWIMLAGAWVLPWCVLHFFVEKTGAAAPPTQRTPNTDAEPQSTILWPALWATAMVAISIFTVQSIRESAQVPLPSENSPAATAIPFRIGVWVGRDIPLPSDTPILQASSVVHRIYTNLATDAEVELLHITVPSSKNLRGHRPETCYAVRGYKLMNTSDHVSTESGHLSIMNLIRAENENLTILSAQTPLGGPATKSGVAYTQLISHQSLSLAQGRQLATEFSEVFTPAPATHVIASR